MKEALDRAAAHSGFLAGLIARHAELADLLAAGKADDALALALAAQGDDMAATLRLRRQGVALVTAIADLGGLWDLTRVTRTLSDFADEALDCAISAVFQDRYECEPRGFAVIALGKHGGQELNYSSDIDPIFLYDPETLPHREREDVADAAVRIGRRVIELLSERSEHGYVFRVDMRLRPSPEVTPIAIPVEAAISYYESSALAWEQAAFIRSRAAAGDRALGGYFLKAIQPFIWRRSLDFGQIANIRQMSGQIRDHYHQGQSLGPGYDLKRGRGGIRECEFFAQAHQLIHGGRDSTLRLADTRGALALLAERGRISGNDAAALSEAYRLLRTIEHRLQMLDDRQTHSLPDDEAGLDRVARLHGLADGKALIALLAPHVARVGEIYDSLAGGEEEEGRRRLADAGLPLKEQLAAMGYPDAEAVVQRLARWRSGQLRAIRSSSAREAFEAILPRLMEALSSAPDPDRALARMDNVLEALPSAINFFHLLDARPGLLKLLADLLSYAPTLADALGRRSELLDGLIDASALELPAGMEALAAELDARIGDADYERLLDIVRAFVGEKRFAFGVQLIEGRQDPLDVSRAYSLLAELAVRKLASATIAEFEEAHGKVPGGELVILALGRLGGQALTHASDLDLVLLFTGESGEESDGRRPLGATQYFNRLAQRVVGALSVQTASGALYDVDTRLRPSGTQGMLCVSVESFAEYQHKEAWTWEHMALTRARVVHGPAAEVEAVIAQVLGKARDAAKLRKDIVEMRAEMAEHKPPKGALDVKLCPGGLVDAEFCIHALQLEHRAGLYPRLPRAAEALIATGLLPPAFAEAQDLLTRLLVLLRLVAPDSAVPPEPARMLVASALGFADWAGLMAAVEAAKAEISAQWQSYVKEKAK